MSAGLQSAIEKNKEVLREVLESSKQNMRYHIAEALQAKNRSFFEKRESNQSHVRVLSSEQSLQEDLMLLSGGP